MFRFASKDKERDEMLENIRIAHKQWQDKESFFEEVTDPDLVDYAIFEMEASKLKYTYLLKKWKAELNIEFESEGKYSGDIPENARP